MFAWMGNRIIFQVENYEVLLGYLIVCTCLYYCRTLIEIAAVILLSELLKLQVCI
jgi:hypothetical protein